MSEGILYAIVALGLCGFAFFLYVKNLSKSIQPKKESNKESEELERISKIQELELQNQKKKEYSFEEFRKLENPLDRKEKFKSSYKRTFPNRGTRLQESKEISVENKKASVFTKSNKNTNTIESAEEKKQEEELKRKEETLRIENLRIEEEKRARAEAVRQKTLENFLYFQQKRNELKSREKM